jgi:hypothetical protein
MAQACAGTFSGSRSGTMVGSLGSRGTSRGTGSDSGSEMMTRCGNADVCHGIGSRNLLTFPVPDSRVSGDSLRLGFFTRLRRDVPHPDLLGAGLRRLPLSKLSCRGGVFLFVGGLAIGSHTVEYWLEFGYSVNMPPKSGTPRRNVNYDKQEKWCPRCQQWLAFSFFGIDRRERCGRAAYCATCTWWIKRESFYHTTEAVLRKLWDEQKGICPVCREALNPFGHRYNHIDHDHITGRVRGWVHARCNRWLILLEKNWDGIRKWTS